MVSIDAGLSSQPGGGYQRQLFGHEIMEIIAFGDIHMATHRVGAIAGIAEADLVLATGDLTNRGGRLEVRTVLDQLLLHNPRVLAQFGNFDRPEVNEYLEELDINLHGQARLVGGEVCLVGLGGSNPTPFNTPCEFPEDELLSVGERALEEGREFIGLAQPLYHRAIPLIFVAHAPPFGTQVDKLTNGRHVGSTAVRALITRFQPELCITGHIHESKGVDRLEQTLIYNPGMFHNGGYLRVTIDHSQLHVTLQ